MRVMKNLRIFLLFICLVSTSFGFAKNTIPRANETFLTGTIVQSNFPNIFRPIKNLVERFLGKPRKIICTNLFADVTNLTLSQYEITQSCSVTVSHCQTNIQTIEVLTKAVDPENDYLLYVYQISAGKIKDAENSEENPKTFSIMDGNGEGKGSKVVWDLSGVAPGTYTITAGVVDFCGVCGQTQTRTVKVVECPNCR